MPEPSQDPAMELEEQEAWAMRLWRRMDRDGNGYVSRAELDCEEFRTIIRSVLTPNNAGAMGGLAYMRSELNMAQAVNYCLRKADLNGDNKLSYAEFRAFLRVLRHQDHSKSTAHLIFALFDLDQDGNIDENEFREVFRFYQGHKPTEEQFQREWAKLDCCGDQKVEISRYLAWLQASTNPIFKQHAPPLPAESPSTTSFGAQSSSKYLPRVFRDQNHPRPRWNQRFNAGANRNDKCPQGQRSYFSKTQSLPELQRFYDTHRGFKKMATTLALPETKPKPAVLSNEKNGEIYLARSEPGSRDGNMRHPITGRMEIWEDFWQSPKCISQFYQPGTLQLRCPGEPPEWMLKKDDV